jgi:hypothetical protein
MKTLTYNEYLADPKIREQIDRQVRKARAEALHRFLVMPVLALFRRVRQPACATRMQMRTV